MADPTMLAPVLGLSGSKVWGRSVWLRSRLAVWHALAPQRGQYSVLHTRAHLQAFMLHSTPFTCRSQFPLPSTPLETPSRLSATYVQKEQAAPQPMMGLFKKNNMV